MSSNSSNASLLPSSNFSSSLGTANCFNHRSTFFIFITFSVTNILLLLPLCISVFYLGVRQWQKQCSACASHSDILTYHMAAIEMIGVSGCALYCCGTYFRVSLLIVVGLCFVSVTSNGQIFFHILTCVERYLAVVHPVTYMNLRNRGGVRIRNIAIGCAWLLFLGSFGLTSIAGNNSTIPAFCLSVLSTLAITYCSLSVLHALIRPGPGDGAKDKEKVDQTKRRAFHTIMAIMGALLLRTGGHLLVLAVFISSVIEEEVRCGILVSGVWFCLPTSLVLPLLFLQRAGKLLCCKNNPESGQGSE